MGLLAFYAATALLGSGGLHAIAPDACCGTCTLPGLASHAGHSHGHHQSHSSCRHHSHEHPPSQKDSTPSPAPCDHDDCLICKYVSVPSVAPVLAETSQPLELTQTHCRVSFSAPLSGAPLRVSNRGPPSEV
jgi:hypothetical protein